MREVWQRQVAEEWGDLSRNAAEQRGDAGVVKRTSNPNFMDIPTSELFASLAAQVEAGPQSAQTANGEYPDAVLLDLVDPPPLVRLLRKLLEHDEATTLRMFAIQSRTYSTSTHTKSDLGTRGYIGWQCLPHSTSLFTLPLIPHSYDRGNGSSEQPRFFWPWTGRP